MYPILVVVVWLIIFDIVFKYRFFKIRKLPFLIYQVKTSFTNTSHVITQNSTEFNLFRLSKKLSKPFHFIFLVTSYSWLALESFQWKRTQNQTPSGWVADCLGFLSRAHNLSPLVFNRLPSLLHQLVCSLSNSDPIHCESPPAPSPRKHILVNFSRQFLPGPALWPSPWRPGRSGAPHTGCCSIHPPTLHFVCWADHTQLWCIWWPLKHLAMQGQRRKPPWTPATPDQWLSHMPPSPWNTSPCPPRSFSCTSPSEPHPDSATWYPRFCSHSQNSHLVAVALSRFASPWKRKHKPKVGCLGPSQPGMKVHLPRMGCGNWQGPSSPFLNFYIWKLL